MIFRDGIVHIEGTREGVDGYVDVSFTSEDNQIKVEIVDHNVNDIEADIDQLNETLAETVTGATNQSGDIEFSNVEVTDDAIVLDIRVRVTQE